MAMGHDQVRRNVRAREWIDQGKCIGSKLNLG